MKIKRISNFQILGLFVALVGNGACSYEPKDAGQCKLTCGSSIIGTNDPTMSIALKTGVVETVCAVSAAGQPAGPYKTAFLFGEAIYDETGTQIATRPVPNISIEPLIVGGRSNGGNADNESNPEYKGIVTAKSNWCSDACGVATLNVMSQCPGVGGASELSIQIHSGPIFSEVAKFPISTPEPTE